MENASAGEIDVPEAEGTVSWADIKRDQRVAWQCYAVGILYYTSPFRALLRKSEDTEFLQAVA